MRAMSTHQTTASSPANLTIAWIEIFTGQRVETMPFFQAFTPALTRRAILRIQRSLTGIAQIMLA